jgi:hypothetical protein
LHIVRASREPVIVPGGSGGAARSPTASHESLEAGHRDGTCFLPGHARLQARRSDHSGQRGAAGTIRAIEKYLPRSSRQGVAQSPRTRPATYKTAFGFIPPCLRPKPPHPPSGHYGYAKSRTTPSTSFHVVPVNPIAQAPLQTPTRSQSCACVRPARCGYPLPQSAAP